jgi:hypothetical protein
MDLTTSLKTKMSIVSMIGPRITDPRQGVDKVQAVFRFAEDKTQIEEIFRSRTQALNGSLFTRSTTKVVTPIGGGRGGTGGRGTGGGIGGGRGRGLFSPGKSVMLTKPFSEAEEVITHTESFEEISSIHAGAGRPHSLPVTFRSPTFLETAVSTREEETLSPGPLAKPSKKPFADIADTEQSQGEESNS